MPKKQYYAGQQILWETELFGRRYYWLRDGDGTIYLAKVSKDGTPDFS